MPVWLPPLVATRRSVRMAVRILLAASQPIAGGPLERCDAQDDLGAAGHLLQAVVWILRWLAGARTELLGLVERVGLCDLRRGTAGSAAGQGEQGNRNGGEQVNGMSKQFLAKLVKFRRIAGQPRAVVCDRLDISHSTYSRMMAILRSEAGGKTKQQRFLEVLEQVEAFIGEGDPHMVSGVAIARAVGCSEGQANRARQTIMRKRSLPVTVAKAAWPADPKPKRPPKLFWTIGDRLFCEHRQPQEVGF